MYTLESENIAKALLSASEITKADGVYKEPPSYEGHASVDAIYDFVAASSGVPIKMREVSFQGEYICARVERYSDRIEIDVNADQDEKWKRFGAIKELAHIKIDADNSFSPYGDERIAELCRRGLIGLASDKNNPSKPATQSEYLAKIAAVEIMFPIMQVFEEAKDFTTGHSPILRLSLERQMPDHYVATALDPEYMSYIKAALTEFTSNNSK